MINHLIDLPEVLALLCRFLDEPTLYRCTLVSREWQHAFVPSLYQTILIHNHQLVNENPLDPASSDSTPLPLSHHHPGLLANMNHVRNLIFPSGVEPIQLEALYFPNLRSIHWQHLAQVKAQPPISKATTTTITATTTPTATETRLTAQEWDTKMREGLPPFDQAMAHAIRIHQSTLTRLELVSTVLLCCNDFWKAVAECPSLEWIHLQAVSILSDATRLFWEAVLSIPKVCLTLTGVKNSLQQDPQGMQIQSKLLQVQELEMNSFLGMPLLEQLWLLKQCKGLKKLFWTMSHDGGPFGIPDKERVAIGSRLMQEIARGECWPELESVCMPNGLIQDNEVGMALESICELKELHMNGSEFGLLAFKGLKENHFESIQVLKLKLCPGVTSTMIQDILTSCPRLEKLHADRIFGEVLVDLDAPHGNQGSDTATTMTMPESRQRLPRPWVCLGLRQLCVLFDLDTPYTSPDIQRRLFERISQLKRLQVLMIGNENRLVREYEHGLDMRLEMGLDQLQGLWDMRHLSMQGTRQKMEEKECQWIGRHWKRLEAIGGYLHKEDKTKDEGLVRLMKNAYGVGVYGVE